MFASDSGDIRGSNRNSNIELTGPISEFNFKDDDFGVWIERFELFVLFNEINAHKKKLMYLTFLSNDG
ncbi:Hypothetical protein CINCED_3A023435 [Cinara cedri]|uniref:Uncharacterized protein n=1 Tax=Cinara cedri TaxID=506608 RepID=A0A5E4MJW7_9HEMI|nr:Hypothetical protein CINCED_3A023435 [Cinara cedri]